MFRDIACISTAQERHIDTLCFYSNEQASTLNIGEMSRTCKETKGVFTKGAEGLTTALREVPVVAKCSLLSQTTIDISQRKTKHKYLQLFMCWV